MQGLAGRTEYTFTIKPRDTNIYCSIFYNIPFDLGYECRVENVDIPTEKCELGKCINTSDGILWGIKRYTDNQIVLQGCGDDEYIYNRINDSRKEIFYLPDDSAVKRQLL